MQSHERQDGVTARAGLPLVLEAARVLDVALLCDEHLGLKQRERGFSDGAKIEALIALMAAGGDCVEDVRLLSADAGFERLVGSSMPSPDALHDLLRAFHDQDLVDEAARRDGAAIVAESRAAEKLSKVCTEVVARAALGATVATLDVDATIIEAHKREARSHYKGGRGYQPVLCLWAEEDLVVCDQFRDGNVPAGMGNLEVIERAFSALPASVTSRYLRADSACYEQELLEWLVGQEILFTISADMSRELRQACLAVSDWELFEERASETVEWTEVAFTPGEWPKNARPLRYIAIRFTKTQGRLFSDGEPHKHLAVVSNREGVGGDELLDWHWQKAGTIEAAHDVMKNELGAGVLPSGLFGANAAWYRISALTYNVLSYLRRKALPERLRHVRPKRLRFEIFSLPAKLAAPQGVLTADVAAPAILTAEIIEARGRLLLAYETAH